MTFMRAQKIWSFFNMASMQDYQTPSSLLADVLETFRATILKYCVIDPCNMYSAPSLAWNAMLKTTRGRLVLLTDIDENLFIESGICGGVAMISNR